jgi:hypothetical protein
VNFEVKYFTADSQIIFYTLCGKPFWCFAKKLCISLQLKKKALRQAQGDKRF